MTSSYETVGGHCDKNGVVFCWVKLIMSGFLKLNNQRSGHKNKLNKNTLVLKVFRPQYSARLTLCYITKIWKIWNDRIWKYYSPTLRKSDFGKNNEKGSYGSKLFNGKYRTPLVNILVLKSMCVMTKSLHSATFLWDRFRLSNRNWYLVLLYINITKSTN